MNDILGHPIVKGATVLTGDYGQSNMVQITTVDKVTKSRVLVTISNGSFNYRRQEYVPSKIQVTREPHQVLIVAQQLRYNKRKYPENLI